jgi:hypothetical protein
MLACFLIVLRSVPASRRRRGGSGWSAAPALAVLSVTDPLKLRPVYAPLGESGTLALTSLVSLTTGCMASAVAFAVGRIIWWTLAPPS